MKGTIRLPERLGPFALWIAPEVYPAAAAARAGLEAHNRLVRDRLRLTLPEAAASDLSSDPEFLTSARQVLVLLEELWEEIERRQSLAAAEDLPLVRRLFLASIVEWALDLHYEVRRLRRRRGREKGWEVIGRAWDGDRWHDYATASGPEETALLAALGSAYCGAIGGLMGIPALDPEREPPGRGD
jgi:hypothetical protein